MTEQTPETGPKQPESNQSQWAEQAEVNKYRINHYIKIEEEIFKHTDEEGVLDLDKIEDKELKKEAEQHRNQVVGGLAREINKQKTSKKLKIRGGSRDYGYDNDDLQKAGEEFAQDNPVRLSILQDRLEKLNELTSYSSEGLPAGQYENNPNDIIKSLDNSITAKDIEIKRKEMEAERARRESEEEKKKEENRERIEKAKKAQEELRKSVLEHADSKESGKSKELAEPALARGETKPSIKVPLSPETLPVAGVEKPETKSTPIEKSPKEQAAEKAKKYFESLKKVKDSAKIINLQAEYQLFIREEIENNPNITQEELGDYLEAAQQTCELETSDKWIESETKYIENYIANHKQILNLEKKYSADKLSLIKGLLGREISKEEAEKVKVEYGPTNIKIFVATGKRQGDAQVAGNRNLFKGLASLKNDFEGAEVGTDVKDSIISRCIKRKGKPDCVIYDQNHRAVEWSGKEDKKENYERYSLENLTKHENGHSEFWLRNQELSRSLKKGSLDCALFQAQNEILSSVINNRTTERFAYKFNKEARGFGAYDYASQLGEENNKALYYGQVEKVLFPQSEKRISLLDELVIAVGGNREKAVALLTREYIPLEQWPNKINEIIKAYGQEAEDRIQNERAEKKAEAEAETTKKPPKKERISRWREVWSPTSAEAAEQERGMIKHYEKRIGWLHSKIIAPVADKLNPIIDKTPLLPTIRSAYKWIRREIDKHPTAALVTGTAGFLGSLFLGPVLFPFGVGASAYAMLRGGHKGIEKSIEKESEEK